jgi:hypothetical protein
VGLARQEAEVSFFDLLDGPGVVISVDNSHVSQSTSRGRRK